MSALTTSKIEQIRKFWADGIPRKRIAKLCGVSENSVLKYCRDLPKPFEWRGNHTRRRFQS